MHYSNISLIIIPMANNTIPQILDFLKDKKKILLMGHRRIDCDSLGSVLAMYITLQAMGKEVTAVCSDPIPEVYKFLPTTEVFKNTFGGDDFIITLDCSKAKLDKIKYNLEGNKVNIVVTPKEGKFSEKEVSFHYGQMTDFDVIMVFDCGGLEQLGKLYEDNVELFYATPVINIDHHVSNDGFGTINWVDPVSASTTEMIYELVRVLEEREQKSFLSPDVATLLLSGIITDTGSFQHANTSPHSMEIAAKLLDHGARQQEIIRHIYKTKKLSTLKLWGTVLSKIQVDPVYRLVWSTVSKADLAETEATSEEASGIIDDLLANAPGVEVILLMKETEDGLIATSLRSTTPQADCSQIAGLFGGGGHVRAAGFKLKDGRGVDSVALEIIEKVRRFQGKRLNIDVSDERPSYAKAAEGGRETKDEEKFNPPSPPYSPQNQGIHSGEQEGYKKQKGPGKVTYLDFKAPEIPVEAPVEAPVEGPIEGPMEALVVKKEPVKPEARPETAKPVPAAPVSVAATAIQGMASMVEGEPAKKKRRRRRKHKKGPVEAQIEGPIEGPIDAPVENKKMVSQFFNAPTAPVTTPSVAPAASAVKPTPPPATPTVAPFVAAPAPAMPEVPDFLKTAETAPAPAAPAAPTPTPELSPEPAIPDFLKTEPTPSAPPAAGTDGNAGGMEMPIL